MAEKKPKYATAAALRAALEDRIKNIAAAEAADIQRLRRSIGFDRLLARLFAGTEAPWVLKGGYALELRMKEGARATRDIDLALLQALGHSRAGARDIDMALSRPVGKTRDVFLNEALLAALQEAAAVDLHDFFIFEIAPAMMDLDGAPYGGARFPVNAILDGRSFVRFHIDIGVGDVVLGPLDTTQSRDWLAFAEIPPARYPTISSEQHFAEKLHAYTMPRDVPNTRTRDLVDMVLLIQSGLDKKRTSEALRATFERRKTHAEPPELSPPPEGWKSPYSEMAEQCGLSPDIDLAFETVKSFYGGLE